MYFFFFSDFVVSAPLRKDCADVAIITEIPPERQTSLLDIRKFYRILLSPPGRCYSFSLHVAD